MFKGILVFIFLICLTPSFAQQIGDLQSILKNELGKAGHKVSFSSSANSAGIFLDLIDKENNKKYRLSDLPGDAFYVKADDNSLHIVSSSATGLRNGVWWYLNFLGFRYYFPNETWYFVPRLATVFRKVDTTVSPSFFYRRIWYAYGTGSNKATRDYNTWFDANLLGGEEISAGHSYDGIVNRNKAVFLQHPEYFAQKVTKGSIPKDPKFEVANEDLVQLVIADAEKQIETAIKKTGNVPVMISLDPSDGGGFSTSAASQKIGGPSEQVFYLVNRVAKALYNQYPQVRIGLYAYNFHASPPSFAIEPNVTVLIATSMNRSKYRTEELVDLWRKKGVVVGLRDYYGVMAWDWDMPGQPLGARMEYVMKLKDYYANDIRLFTAETNIGWISRGPAHYLASRLLWDVNADTSIILSEFYNQMFGKAAPLIRKLYNAWEGYHQAVPPDGDLYNWMLLAKQASDIEKDATVQKRLDQVKQYLHYVVLYKQWKDSMTDKNLVSLFSYAYRLQDEGIMASYPLFRRLGNSYVDGKVAMRFDDPNAIWKKNKRQVNTAETENNLLTDMGRLDRKAVTVNVSYPTSFQNVAGQTANEKSGILKLRGSHLMILQIAGTSAAIKISAGLIKAKEFKTLQLLFYPYNSNLQLGTAIAERTIQPNEPLETVPLSFLKPGLYLVEVNDAKGGFTIEFSGNMRYGILADDQRPTLSFARNNLVFFVGKDTKEFTLINNGVVLVVSPAGRTIDLQNKKGRIIVQVLKGEQGTWALKKQSGEISLQGVMPLLSASDSFLIKANE